MTYVAKNIVEESLEACDKAEVLELAAGAAGCESQLVVSKVVYGNLTAATLPSNRSVGEIFVNTMVNLLLFRERSGCNMLEPDGKSLREGNNMLDVLASNRSKVSRTK